MRRLMALLTGIALGGATVYTAFQYHVVRTDKNFVVVPKERSDWHQAYVDVRGWTFREWEQHPVLVKNLTAAGHADLVARSAAGDLFRGLFDFGDRGKETSSPGQ